MKEIELNKGKVAFVDDEDFERLSHFRWKTRIKPKDKCWYAYNTKYLGRVDGKSKVKVTMMHNVVAKCLDGFHWDHINRNGLDNQKSNLRPATILQNNCNQGKRNDSKRPYRGIKQWRTNKDGTPGRWFARIRFDGKRICSKGFKTAREAAEMYNAMAKKYHGEFAGLNVFED